MVLAVTSLVVVVTCSAATRQPHSSPGSPGVKRYQANIPSAAAPPVEPSEPVTTVPSPSGEAKHLLSKFFVKLRELAQGKRQDHVRVAWLGDSHTAADLWTHSVRRALQARFGVGGPGFFHLGLKGSRHSQVKMDVHGKWQRLPTQPARTDRFADGVFGLGGMKAAAKEGASCRVKLYSTAVQESARWSIYYRVPERAGFRLQLGEHSQTLTHVAGAGSEIQELTLEVSPDAELVLRRVSGAPEFFGAVVEGANAGIVVDTLGIDGARARTPLAWDAEAWEREFARRAVDLVVLAYGTNEVFEAHAANRYVQDYEDLMARIRRVKPGLPCLIIGPTDVLKGEGHSHPRVVEVSEAQRLAAERLGCMYIGAHQLMGGEGSYAEWQTSRPQLASGDGVHLTVSGYRELGTLTSEFLLTHFQRFVDGSTG